MSEPSFPREISAQDRPHRIVERSIARHQQHSDSSNANGQALRFKEEFEPITSNSNLPARNQGRPLALACQIDAYATNPGSALRTNASAPLSRGATPLTHCSIYPPAMESSASPVVPIPSWPESARSATFMRNSPALQAKLQFQHRVSPIDASRVSNHPYSKASGHIHVRGPSVTSNMSAYRPHSPDLSAGRIMATSGSLRDSPRRKRRPEFPTSPRSISRRNEEESGMGSPYDYTHTPSILRVPMTPMPHEMNMPSPIHPIVPSSAGPTVSRRGSSAHPVSSMRDRSPPKGISRSNSRNKERFNAVPRGQPRTDSIPRSYVLKSLNNLAAHFWNRSATADCRIIIPVRNPGQLTPSPSTLAILHSPMIASSPRFHSNHPSNSNPSAAQASPSSAVNTFGATSPHVRMESTSLSSEAELDKGPKFLSFFLHRDYLVTQSTLLQKLLDPSHNMSSEPVAVPTTAHSAMSSFPDRTGSSQTARRPNSAGDPMSPRSPSLRINGAKVLATTSGILTTVWLPLPDPKSFGVLAHWLYWGDSSHLEEALARGDVSWQGLIKNIEYLELDNRIKRVLGSWWRRWVKVAPGRRISSAGVAAATASQQRRKRSANSTYSEAVSDEDDEDDLPFEDPLSHVDARAASPALPTLGSALFSGQIDRLGRENSDTTMSVDATEVAKMMDGLRPSSEGEGG